MGAWSVMTGRSQQLLPYIPPAVWKQRSVNAGATVPWEETEGGSPTSVSPFYKLPYRLTQRFVSNLTTDPVKLTIGVNRQTD